MAVTNGLSLRPNNCDVDMLSFFATEPSHLSDGFSLNPPLLNNFNGLHDMTVRVSQTGGHGRADFDLSVRGDGFSSTLDCQVWNLKRIV